VAYLAALAAWAVIAWRVRRSRNLLASIKNVPARDRKALLIAEFGLPVPETITADKWIRAQIHRYFFYCFIVLCGTFIALLAIASTSTKDAREPTAVSDPETARLPSDPPEAIVSEYVRLYDGIGVPLLLDIAFKDEDRIAAISEELSAAYRKHFWYPAETAGLESWWPFPESRLISPGLRAVNDRSVAEYGILGAATSVTSLIFDSATTSVPRIQRTPPFDRVLDIATADDPAAGVYFYCTQLLLGGSSCTEEYEEYSGADSLDTQSDNFFEDAGKRVGYLFVLLQNRSDNDLVDLKWYLRECVDPLTGSAALRQTPVADVPHCLDNGTTSVRSMPLLEGHGQRLWLLEVYIAANPMGEPVRSLGNIIRIDSVTYRFRGSSIPRRYALNPPAGSLSARYRIPWGYAGQ
jgi:hypothetical protein